MVRVRQLDANHDWTFGKGQNNYISANRAIAQNIDTRLQSFLGDCFFDQGAGIDWWNLLGEKDQITLNLSISAVILNTEFVTGILQLSVDLSERRLLTIRYIVQTIYSSTANTFQFDLNGTG